MFCSGLVPIILPTFFSCHSYFTWIRAIKWLPQCMWSNPMKDGKRKTAWIEAIQKQNRPQKPVMRYYIPLNMYHIHTAACTNMGHTWQRALSNTYILQPAQTWGTHGRGHCQTHTFSRRMSTLCIRHVSNNRRKNRYCLKWWMSLTWRPAEMFTSS